MESLALGFIVPTACELPIIEGVYLSINLYQAFEAWYWNPRRGWAWPEPDMGFTPDQITAHFDRLMGF